MAPLRLLEDNQGAIALASNPVAHQRTKHIEIRHHFVREALERKEITLEYCRTDEMVADALTKALNSFRFAQLRVKMGLEVLQMLH